MSTLHAALTRAGDRGEDDFRFADLGPGFKMPRPRARRRRSWSWQTAMGMLLVVTGIGGLSYPLLATLAGSLGSGAHTPGQPLSALADPNYFWGLLPEGSASDISTAAAYAQAARVSLTRGLALPSVRALIAAHAHKHGRVHVLELNLALDRLAARKKSTLSARACYRGACPAQR